MYWWAKKRTVLAAWGLGIVLLTCYSCASDLTTSSTNRLQYADLPAFFHGEVERLGQENPTVRKTVSAGEDSEQQDVMINDWSRELSSFLAIDLNKSVYRDDILKDSVNHVVTYRIDNPDLDIETVVLKYGEESDSPVAIEIVRYIQNFLYDTKERLRYDKRKGYVIEKHQSVWILGDNQYFIEGEFIQ